MRLFVGILLPESIQDRLGMLRSGLPGARWVEPRSMHVTLRFLGETDGGTAEDIDTALSSLRCPAFDMRLSGVGTFGSDRKVRSLWVGVDRSETLMRLQSKVEQALIRTGLKPDGRKYTPHVTLARFKNDPGPRLGAFLEASNFFAAPPFAVEGFTLFQSHLSGEGPHYESLADYPLDAMSLDAFETSREAE